MQEPTTVLLADDQPVYLQAMVAALAVDDHLRVIKTVATGIDCVTEYLRHRPDLTVVAVEVDDIGGIEVLRRIRRTDPRARVCLTATRAHDREVLDAAQAGACGFLDKHLIDTAELRRQIAVAANGGDAYDVRTLTSMMHALRNAERSGPITSDLTGRQMDVLRFIAAGRSNAEIAAAMFLSINTVKTYVRSVFAKLDVSDRAAAVARGYETGLLRQRQTG